MQLLQEMPQKLQNNRIALSDQDRGTFNFYKDMPIQFNSVPGGAGISTGVTYFLFDFSTDGDKDYLH